MEYQLYVANGSVSGARRSVPSSGSTAKFHPEHHEGVLARHQYGPQVAMDADGDLTVSYSGFGPDVAQHDITQGIDNAV